ncbi:hypothetical protein GW17_00046855 [Ensete ventricosum]|nr:hypothetical protein GW17_00046855 [Ensete ventricosum]
MRGHPRAWLALAGSALTGLAIARGQAVRGSPTASAAACKGDRSCRGSTHARRHHPPASTTHDVVAGDHDA